MFSLFFLDTAMYHTVRIAYQHTPGVYCYDLILHVSLCKVTCAFVPRACNFSPQISVNQIIHWSKLGQRNVTTNYSVKCSGFIYP